MDTTIIICNNCEEDSTHRNVLARIIPKNQNKLAKFLNLSAICWIINIGY